MPKSGRPKKVGKVGGVAKRSKVITPSVLEKYRQNELKTPKRGGSARKPTSVSKPTKKRRKP